MFDPHVHFLRNFSIGNAQLAVKAYCHRYGPMTQDEKLLAIEAGDSRILNSSPYGETYNSIVAKTRDMRTWFVCCEWLMHGVYSKYSCVYYERKFQDGEQDIAVTKKIAAKYDNCPLFGYPGSVPTKRFIYWPGDGNKEKLDNIVQETNYKLHQWSMLAADISDIRIWPLRYDLNDPNKCIDCNDSKVCLPGSW